MIKHLRMYFYFKICQNFQHRTASCIKMTFILKNTSANTAENKHLQVHNF